VDVVWDQPRDPRIDGYEVDWRSAEAEDWQSVRLAPGRRQRVDGLVDGESYVFRVRAAAGAEFGPWTEAAEVRVGPVEVVEMTSALAEMSPGLMWRYFKAALVHAWATR
jgi:hypothetical protein